MTNLLGCVRWENCCAGSLSRIRANGGAGTSRRCEPRRAHPRVAALHSSGAAEPGIPAEA